MAATTHYFVDESGDGVLFGTQGRVLLGQPEGRSHFMLGALQVPDPQSLAAELEAATGREYVTGVVAGYEVMERLAGDFIQPAC